MLKKDIPRFMYRFSLPRFVKAEPEKRTSQIMAEIRRNISSKKRQTQKDRDDEEARKSKKVNEKLNDLLISQKPKEAKEPVIIKKDPVVTPVTQEADEPGNVFDYSFKQANNHVKEKETSPQHSPVRVKSPEPAPVAVKVEEAPKREVKSPTKSITPPPPPKPSALSKKISSKVKKQKAPSEKFYFPYGKMRPKSETDLFITALDEFAKENKKQIVNIDDMGEIVREMKLPFYWKEPLFRASGGRPGGSTTIMALGATWKKICSSRFDAESQLFALLTRGPILVPADIEPLVMDIVSTHPGLEFLRSAPEFHSRYVITLVARLMYSVSAWDQRLSLAKFRRTGFTQVLDSLDTIDDINNEAKFFSYEHFYVIYCKFWELDSDHDLKIGPTDLAKYGDYRLV